MEGDIAEMGKFIGAGLATMGLGGAGIGVGHIAGNFLSGALRNPSAAPGQMANLFVGIAFAEALGIFSFLVALLLMFAVPVWAAMAGEGAAQILAIAALGIMFIVALPILRFYRLSPLWALAQPLIGLFYTGCVITSAWQHWRGKGGMWKGRAQARAGQ